MTGPFILDSIRKRMVVLLLAVMLPMAVMASVLAWQNDRLVSNDAVQAVRGALDVAAARHAAVIDGVRQTLKAIADMKPARLDGGACNALVAGVLASQPGRFARIGVLDSAGRMLCDVGTEAAAGMATGPATGLVAGPGTDMGKCAGGAFAVAGARRAGGAVLLPASFGTGDGCVVADIEIPASIDLAGGIHVWVLEASDFSPKSASDSPVFPGAADLAVLLRTGDGNIAGHAFDGVTALYAIRTPSPDFHLVAGTIVGPGDSTGAMLAGRLAMIAAIMGVALVMIILGAERIVVQPLRQIDRAVEHWRRGGQVDPGQFNAMPAELRELSQSFVQATAALTERETQLRQAVTHQELLMQEIHHRVKNNLQIVASLLNLQASRIRQPEARAEFKSARDRVRALATLHRHLYAHGELHTINMRSFLNELCAQLLQGFGEDVGGRIELDIAAPELQMSSDQAVPIALIVTETVSNAVKFAFPEGRSGTIRVVLTAEGDAARLVIEDDGVGIAEEAAPTGRDGIGLQLIRGFARQLGAMLEMSRTPGTRYAIDMKILQHRPKDS